MSRGRHEVALTVPVPDVEATLAAARAREGASESDGWIGWSQDDQVVERLEIRVRAQPGAVRAVAAYAYRVPYFGWAFRPLLRRWARRGAVHAVRTLGGDHAPLPRPGWAPPTSMPAGQAAVIATLCALLALIEYGGSLLTQTIDYVAETYGASNAKLGVVLALTRVGTLFALAGSALADRRGRRSAMLAAAVTVSVASVLTTAAPTLEVFAVLQVIARAALNLGVVVVFIAITEEAPEGARAWTIAISTLAGSLGFVLGALLLPLADLHPDAWRGLYALAGAGLLLVPGMAKRLPETRRFEALARRHARTGRASELVDRRYGGRFFVLAAAGFLLNLMFAPSSQFTNRYLADERGFSGFGILLLRAATQTITALVALWAGGRLAESRGRKPVAALGTAVLALSTAGFFLTGGASLWILLMIATAAGAAAGPSLTAFNTELFPTEVRGTAGAALLGVAVAGSVAGLVLVGRLAEPFGGTGPAIAVTAAGPALVALLLIRRLPEARGRELDEVSPSEV